MATYSIDLLSVITGIQVSPNDILQAELLLTQTLAAQDPTLDLRTGTAIRDLAVRPNATLLATINKALIYYWSQNSLSNVTDSTPTVFVDKILSNFFMTRFEGVKASISARLYFAKNINVTLTTGLYFSPDNTLMYYPSTSAIYPTLTYDSTLNQWYLQVSLTAGASGTKYNISSGSLIYFSNFNPYFLHAEVSYLINTATNSETNTQFIARASSTISTRNLINVPSIQSNLLAAFPLVSQVYSVGMGDPQMARDKVLVLPPSLGTPVWVHIGGCTDIYCNVPLVSSVLQFLTDVNGSVSLTGPIYKTSISTISGGPNTDTIGGSVPYTVTNPNIISLSVSSLTGQYSGLDTLATLVSTVPHGLSVEERFSTTGAIQTAYNGIFKVVSVLDQYTITYFIINSLPSLTATGTIRLGVVDRANDVGFSARQGLTINFSGPIKSILNVVSTTTGPTSSLYATIVTITTLNHGYVNGDKITMTGLSAGNGTFVVSGVTMDTFQYSFTGAVNPGLITFSGATVQSVYGAQYVSLNIYYHQNIDGIQTYLSDPVNRVLAADQLARGFNIIMLDVSVVGYGAAAPSQKVASDTITAYLASLAPGQPFIMADILSKLYGVGILTIQTPLTITYTKYWRDLLNNTQGNILDILAPHDPTSIFKLNSLATSVASI
jgi:hypothetical protein